LDLIETVEHRTEAQNGEDASILIRRKAGLHSYRTEAGTEILVDASTRTDAGRLGVSACISTHQEFSAEEREAGRRAIQAVLAQVMAEQGIW
jgi:hypothetical protein